MSLPAHLHGEGLLNLAEIRTLDEIQTAIVDQRMRFDREREEFWAARAKMADERSRVIEPLLEEKRRLEALLEVRRAELTGLVGRIQEIEPDIATAAAAKKQAKEARRQARAKRDELELALAELRAYPSAKVEAWTQRRQEMDPKLEPRFPAIEATPKEKA